MDQARGIVNTTDEFDISDIDRDRRKSMEITDLNDEYKILINILISAQYLYQELDEK